MKVELSNQFLKKLARQVAYISFDKPQAARKFKTNILKETNQLKTQPFKYRKSIFFNNENIRQFSYQGYSILYRIDQSKDLILVFGFIKYQEKF